jgi:hypothetical protein
MVAYPRLIPEICGVAEGVVAPAATKTLAGEIVSKDVALLLSAIVTPPAGAGVDRLTGNSVVKFCPTTANVGRTTAGGVTTVTVAVVSGIAGSELAWITVVPSETPVTATLALTAFAAIVTLAGAVATPVLLELRLNVTPPAGAGDDKTNVRNCVEVPGTDSVDGEKTADPVTCNCCVTVG